MSDPTIVEMTVEDPSEEFDKLRDMNDFDVLEPQFKAAGIQINDSPFGLLIDAESVGCQQQFCFR